MKRVVVTGMGCISSLGQGCLSFSDKLLSGVGGIAPITQFDAQQYQIKIAAEVKDYDERAHFDDIALHQLDRFSQFALLATREAVADAGIEFNEHNAERSCVIHGTGIGGQVAQDINYQRFYGEGAKRFHPFSVPKLMPSAASSQITMEFGITGPAFSTTSACSSAGHAIGTALLFLRSGMADIAITGGAEACITPGTMKIWEALRVMARDTCRPFSAGRAGLVIGEGAATLVLETLEHAQARGATILAELCGFGMSSDAHNLVKPQQAGATRAMRAALKDAALPVEAVNYINAHGTGTAQNDPTETQAIREVFGDHADQLAVSSTKSMHGHALGAAAALEAVASIVALREQVAPPTTNFLKADPACDLDYVVNEARPMPIDAVLSNSFAFGGLNTSLVFSRFNE